MVGIRLFPFGPPAYFQVLMFVSGRVQFHDVSCVMNSHHMLLMFLHVQLKIHVHSRCIFSIRFPTQLKSNSLEGSIQWLPIVTSRYCMIHLDWNVIVVYSPLVHLSLPIDIVFHVHSQREWNLRRSFDPNTWASSMGLKKFTVRASQPQRFNPVGLLFSLGRLKSFTNIFAGANFWKIDYQNQIQEQIKRYG